MLWHLVLLMKRSSGLLHCHSLCELLLWKLKYWPLRFYFLLCSILLLFDYTLNIISRRESGRAFYQTKELHFFSYLKNTFTWVLQNSHPLFLSLLLSLKWDFHISSVSILRTISFISHCSITAEFFRTICLAEHSVIPIPFKLSWNFGCGYFQF